MKNLFRYKRRTFITAIAIALGLAMFLIVDSLLLGMEEESIRNLLWYETSSVRIHTKEYWPDRQLNPLEQGIEQWKNYNNSYLHLSRNWRQGAGESLLRTTLQQ